MAERIEGRVIKGLGGLYEVLAADGVRYSCRARGIFRHAEEKVLVGDRVRIYTSSGRVLCDTEALSVTKSIGEVDGYEQYEILIAPDALDPELLSGYDLSSNAAADSKVLIDNLDRNGDGFVYDNVLAENIRSRGFLVKCGGSVIRNCSFRNIGMAAVALVFELEWGESGMAYDTQIENNYFENTGY